MNWFYRRLFRQVLTRPANPIRPRPRPLGIDQLEDRLVPTGTPAVWLSPSLQTFSEGTGGGVFVYRSGGDTTQPLTVNLGIGQDSQGDPLAAWDVDYTLSGPAGGSGGSGAALGPNGGTVTFGPNETSVYLGVSALTDTLAEPTEGFRLTVEPGPNYLAGSEASGGSGGSGGSAAADIQITDVSEAGGSGGSGGTFTPAVVWVGPSDQTLSEGTGGGVWVYRSGGDTSLPLTVNLSIGQDGQGHPLAAWDVDYTLSGPSGGSWASLGSGGGTVTFGPNETAVYLGVFALADNVVEGTEGFRVTAQPAISYTLTGTASADLVIADDPAIVTLSPTAQAIVEGNSGEIVLSRSGGDTSRPLTVMLRIGPDGQGNPLAALRDDYSLINPTLAGAAVDAFTITFEAGQVTASVSVDAERDSVVEGDEGFRISLVTDSLSSPSYRAGTGGTQVTADIRITDVRVIKVEKLADPAEGGAAGLLRFSRSGDTSEALTVYYTVSGSADDGNEGDYVALPGSVVIQPGDTSATVAVTPREDTLVEGPEAIKVAVLEIPGVAVADDAANSVTLLIGDNDAGIVVQQSGLATEVEEDNWDTYTVSLSVQPADAVTVTIIPGSGLLVASESYSSPSGYVTLTFTPVNWDIPQLVRVSAPDNQVVDGSRTVQISHTANSSDFRYVGVTSTLFVVVQDKANPDPKQTADYWKEVARKRIDISSLPNYEDRDQLDLARLRNIRINAAYAELAAANKNTFYWMGLSPFASEQAGKAMLDAILFRNNVREALQPPQIVENAMALAEGNLAVYNDLYWQHLAFAHGGIALLRTFKQQGQITQEHLDAWEKIADGVATKNQDKVWEGNTMLLHYEQKVTLQPYFEKLSGKGFLNYLVKSPVPGGTSFIDYAKKNSGLFDQNYVTRFEDRWKWVEGAIVPEWKKFLTDHPDQVAKFYKEMLDHEKRHFK